MSKVVLVTGATAGIGLATAELFLKKGYTVWAIGRRLERLQALQKEFGQNCLIAEVDVTDKNSVESFFAKHSPSHIDILINNAGLAKGVEKVQEARFEDWQTMIDTNITALMRITQIVLPSISKKSGSHIVNLGSVAGRWAYPGGAVYCATKAAIKLFSQGMRMDLKGTGVRVTNIEPGLVETEFTVVRLGSQEASDKVYMGMSPLVAQDIAESILWCVERPERVNVSELTIFPTDQAGVGPFLVHKRKLNQEE